MRVKKFTIFFLVISLAGVLFLPQIIFAANTYSANFCPWTIQYKTLASDVKILDTGPGKCVNKAVLCYEGFVPCGKNVVMGVNAATGKCEAFNPPDFDTSGNVVPRSTNIVMAHCQLCHAFIMADNVVNFFLLQIVPPLAVLMLVIGGFMFFFGGAKPNWIAQGKTLMKSVAIGLVLIYGAYMFVGEALAIIGITKHNPLGRVFQNGVFSIDCPINLPYQPDKDAVVGSPYNF